MSGNQGWQWWDHSAFLPLHGGGGMVVVLPSFPFPDLFFPDETGRQAGCVCDITYYLTFYFNAC